MADGEIGTQRPQAVEIDDPEDLQDAVIRNRLRHAPDLNIGKTRYVIWSGMLPARWKPMLYPIGSLESARQFLTDAERHGLTPAEEQVLGKAIPGFTSHMTRDERRNLLADALAHGDLWVMRRNARAEKQKASPTVFAKVNGDHGTKIDFDFLAQWEGGQYLHGYVPIASGVVAGNSGVTIATGFDIGQKSAAELGKLGLAEALFKKLSPFAGQKFKGKTRDQVVTAINLLNAAVPTVTKDEADLLDQIIHAEHVAAAISAWNADRKPGVPTFVGLPVAWQTVIFSRFFHQGKGANKTAVAKKFWGAATSGNWQTAITELANYPVSQDWYKARVKKESDYLKSNALPPPVVPPYAKPKTPATPTIPMPKLGSSGGPPVLKHT